MCFGDTTDSEFSSTTGAGSIAMRKPLRKNMAKLFNALSNGKWANRLDLGASLGIAEDSVSARIRDLRKESYGGYKVEVRPSTIFPGKGEFDYRLVA